MEFAYKFRQDGGMSTNAERFAEIVKTRRLELDYNQIELGDAGGPSNTTLTKVEGGTLEELTRTTARKLDVGLRWLPGSARKVWEGGDPTPIPDGVRVQDAEGLRDLIERAAEVDAATKAELLRVLDKKNTA